MSKEEEIKTPIPSWVGNFPLSPDKKRPTVLRKEKAISFAYGVESEKVLCITYISTNHIQLGEMMIPPGGSFEPPDIHSGHEIYYVLKGEAVVFNPNNGRAFRAKKGEVILIPKLVWHKAFNFCKEELRVLSVIAPLQWKVGETEIPSSFPGKDGSHTFFSPTFSTDITFSH